MAGLLIDGVSKRFGATQVLHQIDMSLLRVEDGLPLVLPMP